uniref:Uncharacterized protein n=1 Tax=Craspedostauros australis TaxID=1486917 RepID=A0A7R9ZTE2_9STRA|mmetsp:Transcript_9814/g.26759  ORF Transcript_9814/g.26759 Transcript_9814/m.26759 type:complete len:139 (+) Transcript_9814:256-672(+)
MFFVSEDFAMRGTRWRIIFWHLTAHSNLLRHTQQKSSSQLVKWSESSSNSYFEGCCNTVNFGIVIATTIVTAIAIFPATIIIIISTHFTFIFIVHDVNTHKLHSKPVTFPHSTCCSRCIPISMRHTKTAPCLYWCRRH